MLSTPFPSPSPNPAPELQPPPTVSELPKHLGSGSSVTSFETVSLLEEEEKEEDGAGAGAGMMLYTSGTTNRPKGVLLPASALEAQCRSLVEAWRYGPADRLLHVLPLHHIHGTVNAVLTPLWAGSSVEFLFPFSADTVWRRFALPFLLGANEHDNRNGNGIIANGGGGGGTSSDVTDAAATAELDSRTKGLLHHHHHHNNSVEDKLTAHMSRAPITFFTVVPTVYTRLLATHGQLPSAALQEAARAAVGPAHMRVSISGSAALPTPLKRAWRDLSRGTVLLERYGMTEVGMALSCGLDPADRVDGSVGWPLPGVEARLVDTDTGEVVPAPADFAEEGETGMETAGKENGDEEVMTTTTTTTGGGGGGEDKARQRSERRERSGEIQLRGPNVFREYWNNASATAKEFVPASPDDPNQARWFKTGDVAVRRPIPAADRARGVGAGSTLR